ncbi:MAG TPA: hypothetical protein VKD72_11100, partial [Gemmataceae bacterium]|nr:hypothetical protein [Gemmataceae bacterium]
EAVRGIVELASVRGEQPATDAATQDESTVGQSADDDPPPGKIPPERRTIPLTKEEAAQLMGYRGKTRARTRQLNEAIKAGAIAYEQLTRQSYVFDRNDFPEENWPKVVPTGPTSR